MIIQSNNKITMRSFRLDDVEEFYENVHNDSKIEQYVSGVYVSNITEAVENVEVYEKGDCVNDFYIVIEIDGEMVGMIVAVRTFPMTLDISVIVFEKYRGQGIMKDSMEMFIEWLKENTNYENLSFIIKKENTASLKLAQKLNLQQVSEHEKEKVFILYLRG